MPPTEKTRDITVKGNTYRISKLTPQVGSYWCFRLLGKMAGVRGKDMRSALEKKVDEFTQMSQDDFALFQRDCLTAVSAVLPAGAIPVMNEEGNFAVKGIDLPVAVMLTLQGFLFSVADFFDPDMLESLMGAMPAVAAGAQANMSESTNSSTPPSGTDIGDNTSSGMEPTTSPTGSTS